MTSTLDMVVDFTGTHPQDFGHRRKCLNGVVFIYITFFFYTTVEQQMVLQKLPHIE